MSVQFAKSGKARNDHVELPLYASSAASKIPMSMAAYAHANRAHNALTALSNLVAGFNNELELSGEGLCALMDLAGAVSLMRNALCRSKAPLPAQPLRP